MKDIQALKAKVVAARDRLEAARRNLANALKSGGCKGTYVKDGAPCQGCVSCDYVSAAASWDVYHGKY